MDIPRPRSAGVTAAATFAILGSVTATLLWGYILLSLVNLPADEQGHRVYETHATTFLLTALLPPLVIGALIRTAIGVFHLRPWARVGAMLWAVAALLGSLWLIAFRPFETFFIPQHFVTQAESIQQLFSIAFVFMLFPVSVWWLILFRMKSVRAQFVQCEAGSAVPDQRSAKAGQFPAHKAVT